MFFIVNYWVTLFLIFIFICDSRSKSFEVVTHDSNSEGEESELRATLGSFMWLLLIGTWGLVVLNSVAPIKADGFHFYILGTFSLPVLYAIEVVWFEQKDIREKVVNSFTFKVFSLIAAIALSGLYSNWVSTDLELLTKVSSGVFNEYQAVVVSVFIIFSFILAFHFFGLVFLVFYFFKFYKQKKAKQYMRTLYQMLSMYTIIIISIAYTQNFLSNAYSLYVDTLYENYYYNVSDIGIQDICAHLNAPVQLTRTESNQILLESIPEDGSGTENEKITPVADMKMVKLPSGAVSIVEKDSNDKGSYRFDVATCPISS